jgi:hypothetical protein
MKEIKLSNLKYQKQLEKLEHKLELKDKELSKCKAMLKYQPKTRYEEYYQSVTDWVDSKGQNYKVTFGYFVSADEVMLFNAGIELAEVQNKLYFLYQGQYSELDNSYIEISNNNNVEPNKNNDFKQIKSGHKIVQYKMDINRGYDELWRVIFSIFHMIIENYKVKDKYMAMSLLYDLMKKEDFNSITHNNKLSTIYEILEYMFSNIDYESELETIKYGQTDKVSINKRSVDFLINNNYLFSKEV